MRPYILFLLMLLPLLSSANDLKPFTTDGCSAFADGTVEQNSKWIECCIRHDFSYWKGGTQKERKVADKELKECVADLGESGISLLMHTGVRLGGSPYYPTWYRWGYGWPYLRGYKALTEKEKLQINNQLQVLHDLVGEFIRETKSK